MMSPPLNYLMKLGPSNLSSWNRRDAGYRQMTISNVDEIIALIALYRPGPMDWIPDYIKGKEDPSTIQFPILYWKMYVLRPTG